MPLLIAFVVGAVLGIGLVGTVVEIYLLIQILRVYAKLLTEPEE